MNAAATLAPARGATGATGAAGAAARAVQGAPADAFAALLDSMAVTVDAVLPGEAAGTHAEPATADADDRAQADAPMSATVEATPMPLPLPPAAPGLPTPAALPAAFEQAFAAAAQLAALPAGARAESSSAAGTATPSPNETPARALRAADAPADLQPLALAQLPAEAPTPFAALAAKANPAAEAVARPAAATAASTEPSVLAGPLNAAPPPPAAAPAAPATVLEATLQSRPGAPNFANELAVQVDVMVEGALQSARLELNPPELGPIRIELNLQAGHADISFAAAHAATREGLELALPELRELLSLQGVEIGEANVSAGGDGWTPPDARQDANPGAGHGSGAQHEREARQHTDAQGRRPEGAQRLTMALPALAAPAAPGDAARTAARPRGALDLYA